MKRIEDIKEFEDVDTYYNISNLVEEIFQDRVETHKQLITANKEIERLKQGYCEIKEKCNKGECDCTNEEYNEMCETNIKLYLELDREKSKVKEYGTRMLKAIEYIRNNYPVCAGKELLEILQGEDK